MKIAYFDCIGGASGDMILGALVDCGLSLDALVAELRKLPLKGYQISAERVQRGGVSGTKVTVSLDERAEERHPRSLKEISEIISQSPLPKGVKERGNSIFQRLATAEAKVHHLPLEKVHLHEVGATDAIVDVMGSLLGLYLLGVEEVFASPLPTGWGTIPSSHDSLPIPAPATLELLAMAKAPLRPSSVPSEAHGELVTPTGAAIITGLASFHRPTLVLERIGYGAGSRDFSTHPNVLRLWIGEALSLTRGKELLLLETNIDDMNPELYGYVLERLFEQGARDAWLTPIQMKKNRPGTMLSVLAFPETEGILVETLLRETSTLGIRVQRVQRHESEREAVRFRSSLGPVAVKLKHLGEATFSLAPEFESCRQLALKHHLPLQEVYRLVTEEANQRFGNNRPQRVTKDRKGPPRPESVLRQ